MRRWWIACALVLAGVLSSCADVASPQQPAATLTLIPASETPTPAPSATSTVAPASPTPPPPTPNPVASPIALLESATTPDVVIVQAVLEDLARFLDVGTAQIQVVSIEEETWFDSNYACNLPNVQTLDPANALRPTEAPLTGQRYVLLVGDTLYTYSVIGETYQRCTQTQPLADELLLMVDPVAAEIFFLARRQVANQLSLSTRRVMLGTIRAYTWEDTSLGCPVPDQTYTEAAIDGYRVVVRAAETDYAFHSDAISIRPCPEGQEQLPGQP